MSDDDMRKLLDQQNQTPDPPDPEPDPMDCGIED